MTIPVEDQSVSNIAKQAPHWAALLLVVMAFLFYLDRQEQHADLVAEQRIRTCHAVQDRATTVLTQLSDHLAASAVAEAESRAALQHIELELSKQTGKIESLISAVDRLEAAISNNGKKNGR